MKKVRLRIDERLVELNLAADIASAKAMLMAGEVFVNQRRVDKAGALVTPDDTLEVRSRSLPFASRGGFKLQKALEDFGLDVSSLTAADIGGWSLKLRFNQAHQVAAFSQKRHKGGQKLSQGDERGIDGD